MSCRLRLHAYDRFMSLPDEVRVARVGRDERGDDGTHRCDRLSHLADVIQNIGDEVGRDPTAAESWFDVGVVDDISPTLVAVEHGGDLTVAEHRDEALLV